MQPFILRFGENSKDELEDNSGLFCRMLSSKTLIHIFQEFCLPVCYRYQWKSWVTKEVFNQWLYEDFIYTGQCLRSYNEKNLQFLGDTNNWIIIETWKFKKKWRKWKKREEKWNRELRKFIFHTLVKWTTWPKEWSKL